MLLFRIIAFGCFVGVFPGQSIGWAFRFALVLGLSFLAAPYLFAFEPVSGAAVARASLTSTEFLRSLLALDAVGEDGFSIFDWLSRGSGRVLNEIAWGIWLGVCVSLVFFALSICSSWVRAVLALGTAQRRMSASVSFAVHLLVVHIFFQIGGASLFVEYFTRSLFVPSDVIRAVGALESIIDVTADAFLLATYVGLPLFFVTLLVDAFSLLPGRYFPQGWSSSLVTSSKLPAVCVVAVLLLYPFSELVAHWLRESLSASGFADFLRLVQVP